MCKFERKIFAGAVGWMSLVKNSVRVCVGGLSRFVQVTLSKKFTFFGFGHIMPTWAVSIVMKFVHGWSHVKCMSTPKLDQ